MIKPRYEPLEPKKEQFARNLITSSSQVEAFNKTFPTSTATEVRHMASRLATSDNIRSRFLGLLDEAGAGLPVIANRLKHWIAQSDHPSVSMDGIKTALKISGALDPEDQSKSLTQVAIAIGIMTPDGSISNVTIEG